MIVLRFMCLLPLALTVSACVSYVDFPPGAVGGVDNPIRCDRPEGERQYLKKLRTPGGATVSYEYLDAILGPEGRVLDRFSIENPAHKRARRYFWTELVDQLRTHPHLPRAFRVYFDMYHPGVRDERNPRGFVLFGATKSAGEKSLPKENQPTESVPAPSDTSGAKESSK